MRKGMKKQPNIVMILLDHQLFYRHGADGGAQVRRPCFDGFKKEATFFEDRLLCLSAVRACAPFYVGRIVSAQARAGTQ